MPRSQGDEVKSLPFRPLLIIGAFVLVTGALIFFQPKNAPAPQDQASALPEVTQPTQDKTADIAMAPVAAPRTPEPGVVAEITPVTPAPVIEVTRAAPITLSDRPAASIGRQEVERDEMLFGRLAEERPNLLTATRRAPDGTLRPSLLQIGTETVTPAATGRAAPAPAAVTPIAPTRTEVVSQAPEEPAQTLETFAQTLDTSELRAALAAAPTQAVHTVRLGDSLTTLALRYYDDPSKADLIFEANRRILKSRTLVVGQLLRIPEIQNL
ncbi:LysM peptidoglycan-binding domain-containing protein [Shimia ponticola]|uniref:LysM peptidoglycan-binding domain-containing protein n=1 Tax=Shimia ponticola TaxID=2582893 RepID=UPI00164BE7ED|nr:LysM peptidoglycan-binding domain-containing protein [Shimia ponticola]